MDLKKLLPENGPPIKEVSKYIEKYKNELIVIKYGGNVFIDRNIFDNFITDINILNKLGLSVVVIHGGGPRIKSCLLYTSPSPRDLSTSRMPSSA